MATPPPEPDAPQTVLKPIHSLVLDTGPLIKNDPPVSALLSQAEKLYTIPSVIPEIRDPATRARVETTLLPFVTVRAPGPASIKFVTDFARRTGDLAVLSRPDIEVIALGYELECERNGGDWRLRNTPGQKRLNGRPNGAENKENTESGTSEDVSEPVAADGEAKPVTEVEQTESPDLETKLDDMTLESTQEAEKTIVEEDTTVEETPATSDAPEDQPSNTELTAAAGDDSDDEGWITPSNLKKHQAADTSGSTPSQPAQKTLQSAILTSDYAMQNVALRININLITPTFSRITHLKNWVLRCHGCFAITKEMEKQFCPKCGQPTLTRTSCSTDQHGNFQVHLKKNFQWNNRGNVYSVPKAVHGSANGRLPKGSGGKNGWGRDLILAEDQKEYVKASEEQKRQRKLDIMDQDYLPGILSGRRTGGAGKVSVGAGRNINSKKKR
ncbi:proteasome maturation ans ribosome synthesis protein Nop10 [Pochonia chlamydosporia 170]|uniref:20S-pre-rRNA D-site endonuclease NOB1 n=1 Tax=Pochonia chlamydosporia 170 TaxID=1380566 RepID=A0A179FJN1_METCM|nr:proteasome maturation ans ribosome synthesis protein Nop10 [Pochonia chlamydosporia 170]OAQ65471.1 proteasome maturation ans ribosome synthesis protein Nop10 [Pochonia chlamydosporia 170]